MAKNNTASFVLRFTQKIFDREDGQPDLQWRGNITHVQEGEDSNFKDFEDAMLFMQSRLDALTKKTTKNKSKEEQTGLLQKSFGIWKKVSRDYPKLIKEVIKDPKAQVGQLQEQIQEGISNVTEEINDRLELDSWRGPSKNDFKQLQMQMDMMMSKLQALDAKIEGRENDK